MLLHLVQRTPLSQGVRRTNLVVSQGGASFRTLQYFDASKNDLKRFGSPTTEYNRSFRTSSSRSSRYIRKRGFRTSCSRSDTSANALFSSSLSKPTREPFTILFCGRDAFSCAVFSEVHRAKDVWNDLHITTNPDVKTGRRGSRLDISPLKTLAGSLGVPVHTIPKEKTAFKHWLPPPPFTSQQPSNGSEPTFSPAPSHLLITASFGRILPAPILRLFPSTQRLNVHPSLLPAYRGPAPIQRVLMAGEPETGVCVIEMGEVKRKEGKVVDAGGIWGVERMSVPEDATFLEMQAKLAESGGKLLVQVLRDMLSGTANRISQGPLTPSTPHAPAISANDSTITFTTQSASTIARLERAIGHQRALSVPAGLPDGRAVTLAGLRVLPYEMHPTISGSNVEDDGPGTAQYSPQTKSMLVKCADGMWLSVERLQTQDRVMVKAKEWWNGLKGNGLVKDGRFRFGREF
ncbi:hypothetical protein HYDPIDRAFT_94960 [Hydnomerulius pinastri MD-312]|uniref:methionyl-tRNA formyltransferase n=1 Tax=Hydnomerulius pinastri MD-312 TaxID=994086 RepID=A0A0C9VVM2_9AGAM|nr:hypothetical protein HYDPIDRAFT_94960 [Hydnomerulius pinastri MD-312]